ncbi:unnamed protein product [Cylicocyclus nassatus]|uniref:Major sperm protein n=1 Tax=Cylicocyclus nassatus TaxID=53992 RepID=A0AA36DMQ1_CYLNA|nr:unnamed protein product [Cylicocyclus nassatus]
MHEKYHGRNPLPVSSKEPLPNHTNGKAAYKSATMNAKETRADTPSMKSDKDKPEKSLSVDPDSAYFNVTGGKSDHMLVNLGEKRLAVKIRCSNNTLYRVSPSAMFIEPGQCQNLVVVRNAGPARSDKLILQFLPCEKDTEDCKEFFKQADKNGLKPDTMRISLKMVGDAGYRVIPSREITEDAIS